MDSITGWARIALVVGSYFYIHMAWKQHSNSTVEIPERRTVYDFVQTYPWTVWAAFVIFAAVVVSR